MRRAILIVALLLAAAALGCKPAPEQVTEPSPPPPSLTVMPDLTGKSLDQALTALNRTDLPVSVEFPGYDAHWLEEEHQIAGTTVPARDETISVATRVLSLREIGGSRHKVESQTPAPGAALSQVTTITLLAGSHPNATNEPWLTRGHVLSIKEQGASPCFECHDERACADCHTTEL